MYRCMLLLLINQCMKLPSGGIIFGYFFVACLALSSSDKLGPGYLGASLGRRAPWDGGLNFEGFSRTSGLGAKAGFFGIAFLEAWRADRGLDRGGKRVRHIALP